MREALQDVIHTLYHHSHNKDGSLRSEHCCGCWNVVYDDAGLWLRCNECSETKDLSLLVDPP
jgi:hypothetical protein